MGIMQSQRRGGGTFPQGKIPSIKILAKTKNVVLVAYPWFTLVSFEGEG